MTRTEHLLTQLGEECSEVAQRASKALRFGLREIESGQQYTNAQRIMIEFVDLLAVMALLQTDGHLEVPDEASSSLLIGKKKAKVEQYLKYAKVCGTLTGD